jgi:hypothetical protein
VSPIPYPVVSSRDLTCRDSNNWRSGYVSGYVEMAGDPCELVVRYAEVAPTSPRGPKNRAWRR